MTDVNDEGYGWNLSDSRYERMWKEQVELNKLYRGMIDKLERRIQRLEDLEIIARQLILKQQD